MNAEYLLDAIGQLDDDLLQEAERYRRPKPKTSYGQWLGWAASFAVVIMLGWWVTHPGKGGGSSTDPSYNTSGGGSPSSPAGAGEGQYFEQLSPTEGNGAETLLPETPETDFCAAIMVDGVVYWSTGIPIPIEVDESAVRTATSYTDTVPEADGQTNFSQDLSAQYAMTDQGLVVLVDSEWVLFDPVPPWEK